MNQIKDNLSTYFDVVCCRPFLAGGKSLRRDGSISHEITIKIKRKDSLLKFQRLIGLETPRKAERLAFATDRFANMNF